jgi:hypothetical protein
LSASGAQAYGAVHDRDNKPVPGAVIALIPEGGSAARCKTARTDQNGGFTIKGIPPGEYRVLAWGDVESGAWDDPEFRQAYESKALRVSFKENERKWVAAEAIPAP